MKFFLYPRIQVLKCLPVRHEAETYLSCVCLGGGGVRGRGVEATRASRSANFWILVKRLYNRFLKLIYTFKQQYLPG